MDRRHQTWAKSERFVPRTFVRPIVRFTEIEAASGVVLLAAAVLAMLWANSAWSETYFQLLETRLTIEFGRFHFDETLLHLINDGLMTVFFFVVGLEIKRELVLGELRDRKAAALPLIAALGGMILPALIYLLVNSGAGPEAARGWGIPMATDIAFAFGVVSLLGRRVPSGAKLFLLTLAIVDDIGAIAVIAIAYTADIQLGFLGLAVAGLAAGYIANRAHVRSLTFYIPLAVLVWFFTLQSGVHATLAGVALAFLTPAKPMYPADEFDHRARAILDSYPVEPESAEAREHADHEALLLSVISVEAVAPLSRLEYRLQAWSGFVVVPLFALANAGVDFRGVEIGTAASSTITLGVALGLVVGKTVGISLFTLLGVALRLGRLPTATGWNHIAGLAAVGGIGFTVALFIGGLAFEDPGLIDLAKVGIFVGSVVAGVIGACVLFQAQPQGSRP